MRAILTAKRGARVGLVLLNWSCIGLACQRVSLASGLRGIYLCDSPHTLCRRVLGPNGFARQYPPAFSGPSFGDTTLLYSDETRWEEVSENARRNSLAGREHPTSVAKEHLHLVVQNGRLFQQEHPNVPVILDRGRILLVELDADQARQLAEKSPTCYGVLPLPENQVVFDVRDPALARTARVNGIENLVSKVARSSLEANPRTWLPSRPATQPVPTMPTLQPGRGTN